VDYVGAAILEVVPELGNSLALPLVAVDHLLNFREVQYFFGEVRTRDRRCPQTR
jgi:hypothetical protein